MSRKTVAISIGCPSGVGPEVAVLAAARSPLVRCVLVGDAGVVRRAAALRRVGARRLVVVEDPRAVAALEPGAIGLWRASTPLERLPEAGRPSPEGGAAQLAWINEASDLVQAGVASALVTGPVSKHAISTSGAPGAASFRGHTEHLEARLGAREVVMAFRSDQLATALVTTHLPLARVPRAITPAAVARAVYWLVCLLHQLAPPRSRRRGRPVRIVVAALNPHAGEGGLLGSEEPTRIAPGIEMAKRRLTEQGIEAEITGPIGAETAFRTAVSGAFDGVVAMYHDQATIPCKLLGFGEAVNVTLGLPIVRTSVDHGTGYDIAGTGRADPQGMEAAIALGAELGRARVSRT